jgi:uncharacterized membrane protein
VFFFSDYFYLVAFLFAAYYSGRSGKINLITIQERMSNMTGIPIGVVLLVVVSLLIFLGLAHRVLDRLYLTDKTALLFIGGMVLGSFINIPLVRGPVAVSINAGGALIPIGLAIYVLSRAGTTREWVRALVAAAITAGIVVAINAIWLRGDPWHFGHQLIDPLYLFPLIAGIVAYLAGRSRRASFIAAVLSVQIVDVVNYIYLLNRGIPGVVALGGAGAFDATVVAGIIAVLLAEIVGEVRERLQGGPATQGRHPRLLAGLREIAGGKPVQKKEKTAAVRQETREQGGGEDV